MTKTKVDKQFISRSSTPWTKTQTKRGTNSISSRRERTSISSKYSASSFTVPTGSPKEHIEKVTYMRTEQKPTRGFAVRWHTFRRKRQVAPPWTKKENASYAKSIEKDTLLEETLCASEVPDKKWHVTPNQEFELLNGQQFETAHFILQKTKLHKYHLSDPVFVDLSKYQALTAMKILQFIHQWYDDGEFGKTMAATRETLRFGRSAVARSFDHCRSISKRNLEYVRKARGRLQSWRRRCRNTN